VPLLQGLRAVHPGERLHPSLGGRLLFGRPKWPVAERSAVLSQRSSTASMNGSASIMHTYVGQYQGTWCCCQQYYRT
jgi:hypothetical protein